MHDPLTIAGGVTSATIGVTFASMFPEATPGVMLGALSGAAMYVLTSDPHQFWKQFLFAVISFVGGVFFSVPMAKILAGVINAGLGLLKPPVVIEVSPNIGALVSASISVAVLLRILAKSKRGKMPGLEEEGQ
ncbi:MAG: putative holin [Leclercia adecarboxylata]|nr:putative holin [Leclercia adecarboxylata]